MLNTIWCGMMLLSIITALFTGRTEDLTNALQNGAGPRFAREHQQFINNKRNEQNIDNIRYTGAIEHTPQRVLNRSPQR